LNLFVNNVLDNDLHLNISSDRVHLTNCFSVILIFF